VEGASKFIEGASLYKTFTIGLSPVRKQASLASLEEMHFPLPPQAEAQQPALTVEPLMKKVFRGVLFCPLHRGWRAQRANPQNAFHAI
ncbi:hypothetical protein, partial [Dialister succinatiphilus]|uniref:hypothetical protein n=1 Tax=Dialister succinatiphilus TaxID=487173 RepID=UPI004026F55D